MTPRPGAIVAWWNGDTLEIGMVAGEEKRRIRLVRSRGKDERVQPARIAAVIDAQGEPPGGDPQGRARAGERVAAVASRLEREAAAVDLALLWEIASDGGRAGPGHPVPAGELAELALESRSGEASAVLLLALVADGLHFVRRPEGWLPRERASVERLRAERERLARRREESREFREHLASAVRSGSFAPLGTDAERRYLDALEQLAVHGEATPDGVRAAALEALEASGIGWTRPGEGAFRLCRLVGRFESDTENLQVRRFGLRTSFPDAVLDHARAVAERGFDRAGRSDLTGLVAVSIDGPHTREVDDLLSVESRPGGGHRLGVHIADPAAFVAVGDPVDVEALARGVTHYMPDLRLPMLPPSLSEGAASLAAGEERPSLSFLAELGPDGEIEGFEILLSVVRSARRWTYDEADGAIASGDALLGALAEVGRLREGARRRAGAVSIHAPEVDVHVREDGHPVLERMAAGSPARRAVTEAMVLTGALAARFCDDAGLPAIYRRQPPPADLPELPAPDAWDPVSVRRVRRALRRAVVGLEPGPHASLGFQAYAQSSSPLRRYQDLAIHRQIVSALAGRSPCHDEEALRRIASTTERVEADARRAEEAADEFWLLRHLETRVGEEVEGTVVDTERRVIVQLDETLLERRVSGLEGAEPGQRVRLTVVRVEPRAGLLSLGRGRVLRSHVRD